MTKEEYQRRLEAFRDAYEQSEEWLGKRGRGRFQLRRCDEGCENKPRERWCETCQMVYLQRYSGRDQSVDLNKPPRDS